MKRNIKRVLSLALVFCLVFGMTVSSYATGETDDTESMGGTVSVTNDGISTVDDDEDSGSTESVTVYTGATTTKTFTSATSGLANSSSTDVTDESGNTIATYTIALTSTYTKYDTYSASSSAATSLTSGSSYAIGSSGNYLAVDAEGNLSVVTTVDAYSTWTVTSPTSGGGGGTTYTLYNEATGYYLAFTESTSGNTTSYSGLTTSTSSYSFSWSSSLGFYKSSNSRQDSTNITTYYYFTVSSSEATLTSGTSSSSTGASSYSVTTSGGTTYYTYTITFTGSESDTGTGTVTIDGTTYSVTVKTKKTIDVDVDGETVTLNQSYGWHIANIETLSGYTFAVTASKQSLESEFEYTDGGVTAQYTTSTGTPPDTTTTTTKCGTIYGYDADVYYADDSYSTLNVNVYGSDESGTGTNGDNLSMTVSEGTATVTMPDGNEGEGGAYDENTIYDYDYITIVPAAGYYVSNVVIACNATIAAMSGSPYSETSTVTSFTNESGITDYFGVYGVGCFQMSSSNLTSSSYSPTEGTAVELDMASWISSHAEDTGVGDPYFILIEIEKIPTPLYVEYEAGEGDGKISESFIVDDTDSYATADANSVAFSFDTDDLESMEYLYTVLDPTVTSYTVTENGEEVTYYFAGWDVTYYTTATTSQTEDYTDEETGEVVDSSGNAVYPYLSGTVTLASDTIDYGSGTTLYLFTHVKLVAKWSTNKADVDYVVDFGLPMALDLIETLGVKSNSDDTSGAVLDAGYSWTVSAIASHPMYGTASIGDEDVTYTLTEVMDGADTMLVWLTGTPLADDTNAMNVYGVVEVTIYPATTVYYEEGFATYGTGSDVSTGGNWSTGSTGNENQETHVAKDEISTYNNYGYDDAYADNTGASNSTEAATTTATDSLSFSFTGTGVDIYANCTSSTAVVLIRVTQDGTSKKMLTVDTSEIGETYAPESTSYNTPIASITGLEHGTYDVVVYVTNLGTSNAFNFDGFRVYDTISQSEEDIQDEIYYYDDEDYPDYTEIRDVVMTELVGSSSASEVTEDYVNAVTSGTTQVYTSTTGGIAVYYNYEETGDTYSTWSDLVNLMDDGAKNELYLPAGVTLVLKLDGDALSNSTNRKIQVGVKTTSGTGSVLLKSISEDDELTEEEITELTETVSTVDMFYTVNVDTTEDGNNYIVTISNTGSTTISLTKLKASDDVSISSEAITESELAALFGTTDGAEDEEETAVFEPETLIVSTSVQTGSKSATVTVTVKTSEDVESVIVNGTEVTSYRTVTERSGWGRNATTTTYRQFTYTETVTASGTCTYEVSAVNADGVASAAETATATVTIRSVGKR